MPAADYYEQVPVTTQVLPAADPGAIFAAAAAIERGELIILPTDTVYGLAGNAFDEEAVQRLFAAKRRMLEKGIPILIADVSDLERIAAEIPSLARRLISHFWPGPLTLVLPKRKELASSISQTGRVAVRLPDHEVCRTLIRAAGGVLAATSANLSGGAPAQTVEMALYDLAGAVTIAVDAGPSPGQQASTVVDCSGPGPQILRPGPISTADLAAVGLF